MLISRICDRATELPRMRARDYVQGYGRPVVCARPNTPAAALLLYQLKRLLFLVMATCSQSTKLADEFRVSYIMV